MSEFKLETAVPLPLGTIPGPHGVYKDADGNLLMWADSHLQRGGVAVNADALEAFRRLEGSKFMRLTNPKVRLDRVMPLEEVPLGECWWGSRGEYFAVDLVAKPLSPLRYGQDANPPF